MGFVEADNGLVTTPNAGEGNALRSDFLKLAEFAAPTGLQELEALAVSATGSPEAGDTLARRLGPAALTKACMKQRALGAPSNKIAHAQLHRALSRSILSAVATLWLIRGEVPAGSAHESVRLADRPKEARRPIAHFAAVRPGSISDCRALVGLTIDVLNTISLPKATIAPSLLASNNAIGLAAPFLVLRRHGAPEEPVRVGLMRFMEAIAPDLAPAIGWRHIDLSDAGEPNGVAMRPVRETCCLKYTCVSRRFCGTCPKRV
ncbi:hypothetical protein [Fulvimarina sp. MAC8]|uniref:(2Fe-2S)-binding protein n=1 Tax=Fulvimarina sp. MAC8 TaxID=3162874 RepID=UPI0032EE0591